MKFYRVRAGALQLTLFIAVVIALLLFAFIGIVQTHLRFNLQTDFVIETVENANNGIEYGLNHSFQSNDSISIDLKDGDYKTLKLYKDYWGLFEKITAISKIKNYRFQKTTLVGAKQEVSNRMALYVEDNNKPLVVVGNTIIQGVAYLPFRGAKSGNISGHSYYGEQLIFGATRLSSSLPKLSTEMRDQIDMVSELNLNVDHSRFLDLSQKREFKNSFSKPFEIIYNSKVINLSNTSLIGHIVVKSLTKIVVDQTSKLMDVILIAPEIEIQDNVEGTFQAIATKSIVVGRNCKLSYPSLLALDHKSQILAQEPIQEEARSQISIETNTAVNGMVIYCATLNDKNFEPQILVDEGATIMGEVYCMGNLELKGSVLGTVVTSNFISKQFGSIYLNHIYNGTIIIDKLPQEYVGLEFQNSKKEVMKWLY